MMYKNGKNCMRRSSILYFALFIKHYGDQIKEDTMGGTTYGEMRVHIKHEGNRPLVKTQA
jgi:hypothetical protein